MKTLISSLVANRGSGIEAEDQPYVFDRFYRADKARGDNAGRMGLGLAICKALVTAMGGSKDLTVIPFILSCEWFISHMIESLNRWVFRCSPLPFKPQHCEKMVP
jgi:hypothetical protein